jgi:uncharacterized protein YjbJ (UPF0337 family)
MHMTWDRIQGSWTLVAGVAKVQWGKLTESGFDVIAGRRGQPAGRIQERHSMVRGDTDGQPSGEAVACASLFADTEAGWRSP